MWAERKRLVMDAVGNIADGSGKKVKDLVDAVRGCDVLCVLGSGIAGLGCALGVGRTLAHHDGANRSLDRWGSRRTRRRG